MSAEELALGCVLGLERKLATYPVVSVTLHLVEELSLGGDVVDIASAHVKACDVVEQDCVSPVSEGDVDAQGNITLELPTYTDGWRGYFDIEATSGPSSPSAGQSIPPQRFMAFPRALDPTTYVVRLARGIRELGIAGDVVDPIVPPEKTVILIAEMYGCDGKPLSGVSVSLDPFSSTPAAYPADGGGWADRTSGKGLAILSEVDTGGMWPVYVEVASKYVGDYVSYGFVSLHVGTWLRVILKPRAEWPQWSQEFDSPP